MFVPPSALGPSTFQPAVPTLGAPLVNALVIAPIAGPPRAFADQRKVFSASSADKEMFSQAIRILLGENFQEDDAGVSHTSHDA